MTSDMLLVLCVESSLPQESTLQYRQESIFPSPVRLALVQYICSFQSSEPVSDG